MDGTTAGRVMLERIRKLLAKAERAATPEEARAYTDKAVQLMARHGVDMALLAAAEPGRDEIGATRVELADPYTGGKARLLGWTAVALRCRAVLHQAAGGRVAAVTLFGFATDRERVEVLFTSLLLQAAGELARGRPGRAGESVAAYRRSWLHGFAVSVHRRLSAAEEAAASAADRREAGVDGGPRADLVLADRRERVDRAYADAFPILGRGRRPALSGTGFSAGAEAGERADLGTRSVPGRRALGA
ncbi:MAG: hypothetical protein QOK35_532 [Pseudonocardiales bacterium]|jgi:hypothetical protein|nr:hypothetical protein [Pseudonocardiales bacterium]